MRIRTQADLSLLCASILCLATALGRSQSNAPPNGVESSAVEKGSKAPEVQITSQQLQDQHQQLLKAVDLVRQEAQGQLQRSVTAVERIRKETDASLKRFSTSVEGKLDRLNSAVAAERERDLETVRASNRFALTAASIVVGFLLLEILLIAWLSVRAVNRLTARMSNWISEHASFSSAVAVIQPAGTHEFTSDRVEESGLRLQQVIERLEQRLLDLEHTTDRFPSTLSASATAPASIASTPQFRSHVLPVKSSKSSGVSLTVGQGESLIFLPHEQAITPLRTYRNLLQKLRRRFTPERVAKGD